MMQPVVVEVQHLLLDEKQHHPFLYGVMSLPASYGDMAGMMEMTTIAFAIVASAIVLSVIMKRRSAKPGGRIYQYNQRKVRKLLSDRRRRLRDMLNDPVLVRDMERRYGDISSLRESVDDGFALQKKEDEDFIKVGPKQVVPWIKTANIWLLMILFVTLYFNFGLFTMMIVLASLVHIIDNILLQRAIIFARSRGGKDRSNTKNDIVAAVGVPVPVVDVGIPINKVETV